MSQPTPCPSDPELQRLLRGEANPDTADAFAGHLAQCERCAAAVESGVGPDTLLQALRAQTVVLDPPAYVGALVERLVHLHPSSASGTLNAPSLGDTPPPPAPVEDPHDFLSPPQGPGELGRLGGYRVLRVLGRGGMGVVYEAEDIHLRRAVALKVIRREVSGRPAVRQRFLREARAAAALTHENIVTIYQAGEANGVPFLAMQRLHGVTLAERLRRQQGPLEAPEVIRLGRQVARGLVAAHAAGLVHRDVKPANIWLEEAGGRVKLLDFGLAHVESGEAGLTRHGAVVGTPTYMSPEQARGERPTPRSDLFCLGIILYQLCTGTLPFGGDSTLAVLTALAVEVPRPAGELNPDLPPELAELVTQLLSKDPARRPASAQEVADRLEALECRLAALETQVLPGAAPAARRFSPKGAGLAAAAVLAVLLPPVGYFCGGAVLRYASNRGVLVVEVDSAADVEVTVRQDGAVVRDRTSKREMVLKAGDGEIEVYDRDSGLKLATKRFTLTRGGKETVVVTLEQSKPAAPSAPPPVKPAAADPDRRAAEWALSLGGKVAVEADCVGRDLGPGQKLPGGDFRLVRVELIGNKQVTDDGLAHLEGLRHLADLNLFGTKISDAGMVHLRGLLSLRVLHIGNTLVTETGLVHLKGLTNLQELELASLLVGNGLVHLKGMSSLTNLHLWGTQVTDVGLAPVAGLTGLTTLNLWWTQVTDDGLAHLKGLTKLRSLVLWGKDVTDAGLDHLKGLRGLTLLMLFRAQVSDAGAQRLLAGLPELQELFLAELPVSDAVLGPLKKLPRLRKVTLGGAVLRGKVLPALAELPALTELGLEGPELTDAGVERLGELKRLEVLSLANSALTDRGLAKLHALTNLRELDLTGTRVTPAGVAALRKALPACRITRLP
jgi:hypothetical protein